MKELWTEKYRPSDVEGYVFRDNAQRQQIQNWIDSGSIPHLLFSGAPGVGKSTIVGCLIGKLRARQMKVGVVAVDPDPGAERRAVDRHLAPADGGRRMGDHARGHFRPPRCRGPRSRADHSA